MAEIGVSDIPRLQQCLAQHNWNIQVSHYSESSNHTLEWCMYSIWS